MKNLVWFLLLLLKKKWTWVLGIILILYAGVVPYQYNILQSFQEYEVSRELFWNAAGLYHNMLLLVLVFQVMVQIMNADVQELFRNDRKVLEVLAGVWCVYQILAVPAYIWYMQLYGAVPETFGVFILSEVIYTVCFIVISKIMRHPLAGFLFVFLILLLWFTA